jgi:hypothetical protein
MRSLARRLANGTASVLLPAHGLRRQAKGDRRRSARARRAMQDSLAADRSLPGMPDLKELLGEGSREQQIRTRRSPSTMERWSATR